jgi:hypothetical protein
MFGYPAACVHGNMFAGLHRDGLVLRLDADAREAAIARAGAKPFTAMGGRVMREWVIAPPSLLATDAELRHWIAKAFEHAAALPPKTARQSGQAEATSRRRRRSPGR